jgi:type II secretory pathway pseudopilin PulG
MMTGKLSAQSRAEQHEGGFTLTEIAIVLGIMGLILGAIWVAASGVYNNQKVSKANTELMTIAQGVRAMYSTQTAVDTAAGTDESGALATGGVFPNDIVIAGAAAEPYANGPWTGSSIRVFSSTVTNTGDAFQIEFADVPPSACIQLETAVTGPGRDSGLSYVDAQATAGTYITPTYATFPITAEKASTKCGSAAADVAFTFKLK